VKNNILLKIKSTGREDKELIVKYGTATYKKNFSGDFLSNLQLVLREKGLKIADVSNILPLKSDSFTGFRESVVIANIFNGIYKKVPLNKLVLAKYHKEPNINIRTKTASPKPLN